MFKHLLLNKIRLVLLYDVDKILKIWFFVIYLHTCIFAHFHLRVYIFTVHNNNGLLSYVLTVGIFFYSLTFICSFIRRTKFTVNDSIIISDVLLHCKSVYISSGDLRPGTIIIYSQRVDKRRGTLGIVKITRNFIRQSIIMTIRLPCADVLLMYINLF